jgi:hypothetical protein
MEKKKRKEALCISLKKSFGSRWRAAGSVKCQVNGNAIHQSQKLFPSPHDPLLPPLVPLRILYFPASKLHTHTTLVIYTQGPALTILLIYYDITTISNVINVLKNLFF